ncbi:MAG: hypothetical protein CXT64_06390 [Methanobacteriota archaeon]|nr:MAG: hypothetical protein CXT64_06390 [Euryarchaeota archaeon]
MAQNLTAHNFDWLTFTGQSLSGKMVLVPGYCTIVPRNLSVRFHRWKGFQWDELDARVMDAHEYHDYFVTRL